MRTIDTIAIHCSATRPEIDIGAETIRRWHVVDNGWSDIGYHYVIRRNGDLEYGRPIKKAGAHVKGHNRNSIGICLVGGVDINGKAENNFNKSQFDQLSVLVATLKEDFHISNEKIKGHRDFPNVKKDCPCFDVQEWLCQN